MTSRDVFDQLDAHIEVMQRVKDSLGGPITECAQMLAERLGSGGKLLVMGNGGSAADAQHLAAELVGRFLLERRALPAIALTTDSSILTAVGNDYGFDNVFTRQVEALGAPGDVVIGISTSGNSANVVNALKQAKTMGLQCIGLLGGSGGCIAEMVDLALVVPCDETPRIQEAHLTIIHLLCDLIEKQLFGDA
ncbi:MAG: D-sedoheptulose 7-phosphate isomerase [Desulfuromonadales bacterium]|nr:D-sedoheptulose 7-phosphate isomerase [Desulfuromonadales bacterium]